MQRLSTILSFFALLSQVVVGGCSKKADPYPADAEVSDSSMTEAAAMAPIVPQPTPDEVTNAKPDGSATLRQLINSQSKGLIELVSYRKMNGLDEEFGGVKYYTIEYQAVIKFLSECYWVGESYNERLSVYDKKYGCTPDSEMTEMASALQAQPGSGWNRELAKKDQHATMTGTLKFQLAENGWRIIRCPGCGT